LFFAYLIIFFFTIFLFIKWITNKKEKKNSKQETELKK
jgi:preprotein translocase subunit SecG